MEMFEKASKLRLTFDSGRGTLSHQDLWALPLKASSGMPSLDSLARRLHNAIEDYGGQKSFVDDDSETPELEELKFKFEVVKHVIKVRLEEKKAEKAKKEREKKKAQILKVIESKQNEKLLASSIEELQKMVKELDD